MHCIPGGSGIGFENSADWVLMPRMTLCPEGGMGFALLPQAGGGTFYAATSIERISYERARHGEIDRGTDRN
jgi:hypothetical protein